MRDPRPQTLAILSVGLVVAVLSALSGCGASALQVHAQTALVLRGVNDATVTALETGCQHRAVAAATNPDVDHAQASADAHAVLAHCQVAADAQHAFASALDAYVDQLIIAVDEGDTASILDRLTELARSLIPLYADLARVGGDIGVDVPELPPFLSGLTNGH